MSEFTKGKWKCEIAEYIPVNGYWYRITDEEGLIAICMRNKPSARLIAAAPEMYEMIKNLVDGVTIAELLNGRQIIKVNPVLVESAKQLLTRVDGEECVR